MEIVHLLKCIMCIAWTFQYSPQKPPMTYTRVNDFRPHRDSLFRGATYTRERLIREYIRYLICQLFVWCLHCLCVWWQNTERNRHSGPAVDVEHDVSWPSSSRVHHSPMENICPDLAARIIEDALSPTPLQNVDLTSRCCCSCYCYLLLFLQCCCDQHCGSGDCKCLWNVLNNYHKFTFGVLGDQPKLD